MKLYGSSKEAIGRLKGTVVTLGVFDGVHLGHRHLFKQCIDRARELNLKSVVYTFDPHPVRILSPDAAPPLITTTAQKTEILGSIGFDICVVEPFTKKFSQQKPRDFFQKILAGRLQAREIFVGYDFTFGVHRSGTTTDLKSLGEREGVSVHVVDAFLLDEFLVSSSAIRQQIAEGRVEIAERLLGYPYFVDGKVVRGEGLGATIGIPTANLELVNELLPASGVYATHAIVSGRRYRSVTNVGTRPTFKGKRLQIETHILHFKQDIPGKKIRLEFLSRFRPELRFADAGELVMQIKRDIKDAEKYFRT